MAGPQPFSTVTAEPGKYLRPRDAATLIILDTASSEPKVLMGRRRSDLAFMPSKYVFPGGRIDLADGSAPFLDDLDPALFEKLEAGMRGRPSTRRARALALTAIRETLRKPAS